jgi:tetratricopeptide (TPR) repeat protein
MMARSFILLLMLAAAAAADALPAEVAIRGSRGKDVVVVSRQRGTVTLQLPEHRLGTVKVAVEDINSIQFALPSVAQKAVSLYQQGKWEGCSELLRPVIGPFLAYVDLPNNNVLPLAEKYAESLRQSRKYADAVEVYQRLKALPAPKLRQRATVSMAYCSAALLQPAEAAALLREAAATNHHEEAFGLAKLVEARIHLQAANALGAIDAVAQAIASLPIDSPYYAECLVVSAECYEKLGDDMADGALGDEYRTEAAYADQRPAPPAVLTNLFVVARSINEQVTNLYPDTLWSADAMKKITEMDTATNKAETASAPAVDPSEDAETEAWLEEEKKR